MLICIAVLLILTKKQTIIFMKIFFIGITSLASFSVLSQELPDKIVFDYDSSGNQIFRGIVIEFSKSSFLYTSNGITKNEVENIDNSLEKKGYSDSKLNYYPNPVRDVLNIDWDDNFKKVDYIVVNTSTGQRLQIVSNLSQSTATTLDFINVPVGVYYLTVVYKDKTEEIIKIIKK